MRSTARTPARAAALAVIALPVLLPLPEPGPDQSASLDEGIFDIYVDGERAGTERFSIRRSGTGPEARIIAQATVRMRTEEGSREMALALETVAGSLRPTAYQIKISGTERMEITGRLVGRRFSAKVVSERGEEAREYQASRDALIIDRSVAHQYYFLARRSGGVELTVPVIVPRLGRQVRMDVAVVASDTIRIARTEVRARRLRISVGEGDIRHLWVDGSGRVLRVEIPALDYRAERREVPG